VKIIRLAVESDVVVIGGQNGAGKTSVLDAIAYAIGGKRLCPAKPLREGTKKGSVEVDLGEMKVVRTFTRSPKSGEVKSEIVVTETGGGVVSSPQALLDRLVGDLSFDPLEFTRMRPEEQVKVLRQVAGVDTSAVDKEISAAYEARKAIGVAVKQAEELEHFADAP
jgi:DNA repair ATPase RecN